MSFIKSTPVKTGLAISAISILGLTAYSAFQLNLKADENKKTLKEQGYTLNKADLHK